MSDTVIEGLAPWELESVSAINDLEAKAARPEGEASDIRWTQAEKVAAALEAGLSQQKLAANWRRPDGTNYSQQHVSLVKRVWDYYYSSKERPRFYDAYNSPEVRKADGGSSDAHVRLLRFLGEDEMGEAAVEIPRWVERLYFIARDLKNNAGRRVVYDEDLTWDDAKREILEMVIPVAAAAGELKLVAEELIKVVRAIDAP